MANGKDDLYVGGQLKSKQDLSVVEKLDNEFLKRLAAEYEEIGGDKKKQNQIKILITDNEYKEAEKARKDQAREGNELSVEEQLAIATELLPDVRKYYNKASKQRELFIITDHDNKLGVTVSATKSIYDTIEHLLAENLIKTNRPLLSPFELSTFSRVWYSYSPQIEFEVYGGFDTQNWALGRALVRPGELMATPAWSRFLGRLSDPEAFLAWIYGVASKKYKGRQILWEHGENGEDGKTATQKIFVEALFKGVAAAVQNVALTGDGSRFVAAEFENKVLAYWDDCPNQMALFTELVKTLSAGEGGNAARIEKKGQQAYQGQLNTRMWICSNFPPRVSGDNFIKSRLLYIHVEPMNEAPDPTILAKMKAELPHVLALAERCYSKRCPDNYKITQNQETLDLIEEMTDEFNEKYQDAFDRHFVLSDDPNDVVMCSEINAVLKIEGISKNTDVSQWYDWISMVYRREKKLISIDGQKKRGIRGLKMVTLKRPANRLGHVAL